MIKLVDPQLKTDGTIEKIFDPAMGTGGFLISSLRYLLQQSKTKGIKINWDFISNEGLGGREAEHDTYQLAISNILISSGRMFNVLEKGDSIRDPIINKYDIVIANPPFGIDGLIYNEILHPLRNEYMPIRSNSAVPLFLQAIIYMLKINGRCAVVLPNGKELFSKNNKLVNIRQRGSGSDIVTKDNCAICDIPTTVEKSHYVLPIEGIHVTALASLSIAFVIWIALSRRRK
jgi:type I restriction enzyme M protein